MGGKGAPVYAGAALVKGRAATRVMYTTQCSQQCGREAPLPKNASAAGLQGEGWVSMWVGVFSSKVGQENVLI